MHAMQEIKKGIRDICVNEKNERISSLIVKNYFQKETLIQNNILNVLNQNDDNSVLNQNRFVKNIKFSHRLQFLAIQ